MKNAVKVAVIVTIVAISACKKEHFNKPSSVSSSGETNYYSSVKDFFSKNGVQKQVFTINSGTGGVLMSSQGTTIAIPPNAFVTQAGVPVAGDVTIEFKDLYKKSDMLLSGRPTMFNDGSPMKSGGEFFIKASFNNSGLKLATEKKITVDQPASLTDNKVDSGMVALVIAPDSLPGGGTGPGWVPTYDDTLRYLADSYVFNLYTMSSPADSGTWCNSDNWNFFSAYNQAVLNIHQFDDPANYGTNVFLVFKHINSMVHVYQAYGANSFPYNYAPLGLECTVVAVGVKSGKLYASFSPITVSANQTVNFLLTEMSTTQFINQLKALD